ncbi:type IV pilus modification PilV family protein [Bowmanella denitrificans]|uniref:type IV pilus modification PilV family protein n=1 Tax=Bowmanella denitrificans TaxID=366582 RepID=UPI000C999F81|nr:prepilin-type N-terminal cleavage/methylation domain-containing protein [Bowmanella denitrificans]
MPAPERGFTLIELIIGITAFAVALTLISSLILPQASRSVEPIYQARAAELAQSLLNEISGRAFDHHSDRTGGLLRCGEDADFPADGLQADELCTAPANLGCEEGGTNREAFNDVDDYICLSGLNAAQILNPTAAANPMLAKDIQLYQGFEVQIAVFYDANKDGSNDNAIGDFKLINLSVTTPAGEQIAFSTYKGNY